MPLVNKSQNDLSLNFSEEGKEVFFFDLKSPVEESLVEDTDCAAEKLPALNFEIGLVDRTESEVAGTNPASFFETSRRARPNTETTETETKQKKMRSLNLL
ncbi:hypothetical protein OAE58_00075 [Akkermansiaceae bacterium]|nr:hypothetical protein [Akkermansiaceae bacterium]MDB4639432.1 hypothetical protein [Akkermansiaceae bacterium]